MMRIIVASLLIFTPVFPLLADDPVTNSIGEFYPTTESDTITVQTEGPTEEDAIQLAGDEMMTKLAKVRSDCLLKRDASFSSVEFGRTWVFRADDDVSEMNQVWVYQIMRDCTCKYFEVN